MRGLVPVLLLLLAACGGPELAGGSWHGESQGSTLTVQFADDGRLAVCRVGADGTDRDCEGTWALQGDQLLLQGKWQDDGAPQRWTGTFRDGALAIAIEPERAPVQFHRR